MATVAMLKTIRSSFVAGIQIDLIPNLMTEAAQFLVLQSAERTVAEAAVLTRIENADLLERLGYELIDTISAADFNDVPVQIIVAIKEAMSTRAVPIPRDSSVPDDDPMGNQ